MPRNSLRRLIEGRHHPLLKMVRRMLRSGELWMEGRVLLETPRLLEEALASGAGISQVLLSTGSHAAAPRFRDLLKKLPAETAVYEVVPNLFPALTTTQTSPGILALAAAPSWQVEDLFRSPAPLVVVLAGLQDPGNLGTILRTAEAFGASGALLTEKTVSPYNAKAVRATAGALFRLPVLRGLSAAEAVALLRRNRVRLFTGVVEGGKRLPEIDLTGPVAVALGSEGAGLPPELEAAGEPLTIPMAPAVESLNVATAAAVILYEIARQRVAGGKDSR